MSSDADDFPDLLKRAKHGGQDAFLILFQRYCSDCIGWTYLPKFFRSTLGLSDVGQETWMQAWDSFRRGFRGDSPGEFKAWLRIVLRRTRNAQVDYHNAQKRRPADADRLRSHEDPLSLSEFAAEQTSVTENVLRREDESRLSEAMAKLPERQKLALELQYFEGCTIKVVAERLHCSPEAAAGLLRRGKRKLHELLEPPLGGSVHA